MCSVKYTFVCIIGYYSSPAFTAGSIDASVHLAPSTPLPAPIQSTMIVGGVSESQQCLVESSRLTSSPWASNYHEKKSFQIEPSRIFSFRCDPIQILIYTYYLLQVDTPHQYTVLIQSIHFCVLSCVLPLMFCSTVLLCSTLVSQRRSGAVLCWRPSQDEEPPRCCGHDSG